MPISYEPLWNTMKEKHISTYHLIKNGFSKGTLDRIKHNKPITTKTLEFLCRELDCQPNDVIQYIP